MTQQQIKEIIEKEKGKLQQTNTKQQSCSSVTGWEKQGSSQQVGAHQHPNTIDITEQDNNPLIIMNEDNAPVARWLTCRGQTDVF